MLGVKLRPPRPIVQLVWGGILASCHGTSPRKMGVSQVCVGILRTLWGVPRCPNRARIAKLSRGA